MANQDLLRQRALAAIKEDNFVEFSRWTRHPRWKDSASWAQEAVLAALACARPVEWFDRLEELGVRVTSGFSRPALCEAADRNDVKAMTWLLDHGADPDAVSDFGLGPTAGQVALNAGSVEAMELLWARTGRLWSLVGAGRLSVWTKPKALPVLQRMIEKGWTPDTEEPDPSGLGNRTFRQMMEGMSNPIDPSVLAWMDSVRLEAVLPCFEANSTREKPRI